MSTVHNPLNFEPRDYEVSNYLDNRRPQYAGGPVEAYVAEVAWWEREMQDTFGADWHRMIHKCVHCGNSTVRWITAVRYIPTGAVVCFGAVCTERLGFRDRFAFKLAQLKAKADARNVRFTIWNKREAFIKDNPSIANALEKVREPAHANNSFVKDVLDKLDCWGSLSEAQVKAVAKSLARDVEFAARKAAEALEVKGPAPTGRAVVTGEVLSTKLVETAFGTTRKMLLKLANASRVWLSVPGGSGIERGDTVTVRATFEVSKDDPHFAFGSRPHLVNRVSANEPEPVPTDFSEVPDGELNAVAERMVVDPPPTAETRMAF